MKPILFALCCAWLSAGVAAEPTPKTEPAPAAPAQDKQAAKDAPQPAAAILLGKEISGKESGELTGAIVSALFKRYADDLKIHATEAEIDSLNEATERMMREGIENRKRDKETLAKELKSPTLSDAERKEKEKVLAIHNDAIEAERKEEAWRKANPKEYLAFMREGAQHSLFMWKLHQSLFQEYGGRVISGQSGPEPWDAYRLFLKDREKKGDFKILDEEAGRKFWDFFTNEAGRTFYSEAEGKKLMTTPWWLEGKPAPPVQPVTAILFGKEITAKAGDELTGTIVAAVLKRQIEDLKLGATDAEIDAFNEAMDRTRKESVEQWKREKAELEKAVLSPAVTEAERKDIKAKLELTAKLIDGERENDEQRKADPAAHREAHAQIANQFIVTWKLNQALFEKHGGRVIFQQAGPEPMGAYREFLKAREKDGAFKILDEEARKKFWETFVEDGRHSFYSEEEGRRVMTTPWWLGKK